MRKRVSWVIVGGALACSALVWVVDAWLDALWFKQQPLIESLLTNVQAHEAFMRLTTGAVILAFGIVTARYVHALARIEAERDESQRRYRLVVETMNEGVIVRGADRRIVYANACICQWLGRTLAELQAADYGSLVVPEERAEFALRAERRKQGDETPYQLTLARADGRRIVLRISPRCLRAPDGSFAGSFAILTDITEREAAARAFQREKDKAQQYLDIASVLLVVLDREGRVVKVNRRGSEILVWQEDALVGQDWVETCVPGRERARVRETFARLLEGEGTLAEPIESPIQTRIGEERLIAWHYAGIADERGRIVSIIASGEDITDRRRAEREREQLSGQLRQMQKMEALGQLAAGVAHDFNNLLTAVVGNAELLRHRMRKGGTEDRELTSAVDQIERAGERAATLTRQLLTFSRRQPTRFGRLDLNTVLRDLERMLRRLIPENINLAIIPGEGVPAIWADAGEIEQVLINLAVNARDAMERGGTLTIATAQISLAQGASEGGFERGAVLIVNDTGEGMTPEVQEHIFEPFYTTKSRGQGTGLGLSTVYGIVERLGGRITVDSAPERGATFHVYLPAATDVQLTSTVAAAPAAAPNGGHETILLCEDDPLVRELVKRTLTLAGYTVLAAGNGREAFALGRARAGEIRLLLTDVIVPDMDGRDLARSLSSESPGLRVLLMSGYAPAIDAEPGDLPLDLLPKPFSRTELLRRLRAVLDRPAAAAKSASNRLPLDH